jgi:U3 small nucleolar RNA-associated protein 12
MGCGYALCSVFAPGDRHVVLGTKGGKLQIFDINTGQMTEEVAAHTGEVWAMALTADR